MCSEETSDKHAIECPSPEPLRENTEKPQALYKTEQTLNTLNLQKH